MGVVGLLKLHFISIACLNFWHCCGSFRSKTPTQTQHCHDCAAECTSVEGSAYTFFHSGVSRKVVFTSPRITVIFLASYLRIGAGYRHECGINGKPSSSFLISCTYLKLKLGECSLLCHVRSHISTKSLTVIVKPQFHSTRKHRYFAYSPFQP